MQHPHQLAYASTLRYLRLLDWMKKNHPEAVNVEKLTAIENLVQHTLNRFRTKLNDRYGPNTENNFLRSLEENEAPDLTEDFSRSANNIYESFEQLMSGLAGFGAYSWMPPYVPPASPAPYQAPLPFGAPFIGPFMGGAGMQRDGFIPPTMPPQREYYSSAYKFQWNDAETLAVLNGTSFNIKVHQNEDGWMLEIGEHFITYGQNKELAMQHAMDFAIQNRNFDQLILVGNVPHED